MAKKKLEIKDLPKDLRTGKRIKSMQIIKKVLLLAIFMFMFCAPLAQAGTYYNNSVVTMVDLWYREMSEEQDPQKQVLTFWNDQWSVDVSAANEIFTNVSDNERFTLPEQPNDPYGLWANFTITESEALVNNMTLSWEGYSYNYDTGATNRTEFYIWNGTNFQFLVEYDSDGKNDSTKNIVIPSPFANKIHDGRVYILITNDVLNITHNYYLLATDFLGIYVAEGAASAPTAISVDDTYPNLGEEVFVNFTMGEEIAPSFASLMSNETGAWARRDGLYNSPRNFTEARLNVTNFTWSNTTLCNLAVGFRIWFNDTSGVDYYSNISTVYSLPYVNSTTFGPPNISSTTCDNSTHIELTWNGTDAGILGIWISDVGRVTPFNCSYTGTGLYNISNYNRTSYCVITAAIRPQDPGGISLFVVGEFVSFTMTQNLPAAILATTVLSVIVIYVVSRKYKSGGWT